MNAWELSSLGVEFAFIFVGAVLLGNYLDEKFSLDPWGLLLGAVLGFSAALYHIIHRANTLNKHNKD